MKEEVESYASMKSLKSTWIKFLSLISLCSTNLRMKILFINLERQAVNLKIVTPKYKGIYSLVICCIVSSDKSKELPKLIKNSGSSYVKKFRHSRKSLILPFTATRKMIMSKEYLQK